MRSFMLNVIVLLGFFFILLAPINAQDLELKKCATPDYWHNVSDCNAHINTYVLPCLQGGHQGNQLPDSIWSPGASFGTKDDEKCIDTNNDGKLDESELNVCKRNFSNYMCRNMPFSGYIGGSCGGVCNDNLPDFPDGQRMWEVLGAEYERQYTTRNSITPTPTATLAPTPPPGTVDAPINCLSRIGSSSVTTSCQDGLTVLASCLSVDAPENINRDESYWQEAINDPIAARNRINAAIIGNSEINKTVQCIDTTEYDDFLDKFQSATIYIQGTLTPIPTPAEEGGWFFEGSTIETPMFGVDCGIADSSDAKLRQCCIAVKGEVKINAPDPISATEGVMEAVVNGVISVYRTAGRQFHAAIDATIVDADPDVNAYCMKGRPSSNSPYDDPSCICEESPRTAIDAEICAKMPTAEEQLSCAQCLQGISIVDNKEVLGKAGIWTGAGCVQTNLTTFIEKNVFGPLLGFAGMVALGCIIYSAFIMQTSQGNPEQVQKAQELITSCIMGLILIILSVFVLRVIGVDILRIPGFSS